MSLPGDGETEYSFVETLDPVLYLGGRGDKQECEHTQARRLDQQFSK